jgi:hypothetical protein
MGEQHADNCGEIGPFRVASSTSVLASQCAFFYGVLFAIYDNSNLGMLLITPCRGNDDHISGLIMCSQILIVLFHVDMTSRYPYFAFISSSILKVL